MATTKETLYKEEIVNRCMDSHNQLFQSLHKGKTFLEENLKMLMAQAGITPTSTYKAVGNENNETTSSLKIATKGENNAVS